MATNLADVPAIASQISAAAEEDESEEALQRRIERVKAERERLAKIEELSKVEEELERRLAAKRGAESSQLRTISLVVLSGWKETHPSRDLPITSQHLANLLECASIY